MVAIKASLVALLALGPVGASRLVESASPPEASRNSPAAPPSDPSQASDVVRMRIEPGFANVLPGGSVEIAVVFASVLPHWHTYWINPGESGAPTILDIQAPDGFVAGPVRFPRPQILPTADGACYGYEGSTAFFFTLTAPPDMTPQPFDFPIVVTYLVCREQCLLGRETLRVHVRPDITPSSESIRWSPEAKRAHDRLPRALEEAGGWKFSYAEGEVTIELDVAGADSVGFLPIDSDGIEWGTATTGIERRGEAGAGGARAIVRVPVEVDVRGALGRPMAFQGLVTLGSDASSPSFQFKVPVKVPVEPGSVESRSGKAPPF